MEVPKETPCVAILNHKKYPLFLLQNWKIGGWNRFCLGGWYNWEGEGGGERVWEGEYGANTYIYMYVNGKMRPVESIPGMGEWGIKENGEGDDFKYPLNILRELR
jgi:hypothetical protein